VAPHIIQKKRKTFKKGGATYEEKDNTNRNKKEAKTNEEREIFDSERVRSPFDLCTLSKGFRESRGQETEASGSFI